MQINEAKELLATVFGKLKTANTLACLDNIMDLHSVLKNNQLDRTKYPELEGLTLSDKEIETLCDEYFVEGILKLDVKTQLITPLEKLFYAALWKNGDLVKIKHIVRGAKEAGHNQPLNAKTGLVFNQLGRHLVNGLEVIVDQHVLRAFVCFRHIDQEDPVLVGFCKQGTSLSNLRGIQEYKDWIKQNIQVQQPDFLRRVDEILFALGKAIKVNKGL